MKRNEECAAKRNGASPAKRRLIYLLLSMVLIFSALPAFPANAAVKHVLCIGESLTCGSGSTWNAPINTITAENTYPGRMGALLGNSYVVKNLGVSGVSVLPEPTWDWSAGGYLSVIQASTGTANPLNLTTADYVFLFLGINDCKPRVWNIETGGADNFYRMYKEIVEAFQGMETSPEVICVVPGPVLPEGLKGSSYTMDDDILKNGVSPQIRRVAQDTGCQVVDLRELFPDRETEQSALLEIMADGAHPNPAGYDQIAWYFCKKVSRVAGDSNEDGRVSSSDLTNLAKLLAGWTVYIRQDNLDLNGDNKLDVDDLSMLARKNAGWSITFVD